MAPGRGRAHRGAGQAAGRWRPWPRQALQGDAPVVPAIVQVVGLLLGRLARGALSRVARARGAEEVGLGAVVWGRQRRGGLAVARLRRLICVQVEVGRFDRSLRHLVVGVAHGTAHVGRVVVRVNLHLVVVLLQDVGTRRGGYRFLHPLLASGVAWVLGSTYGIANVVPAAPGERVVATPELASHLLVCGSAPGD